MKKKLLTLLTLVLLAALLPTSLADEESLWGQNVKAKLVSPPARAFDKALYSPYIAGISANGNRLLIAGFGGSPYLWDVDSKKKLYLAPGNDAADERLNLILFGAFGRLPEESRDALRERLETQYANAPGDARLAMLLDQHMDASMQLGRSMFTQGTRGDYMRLCNPRMPMDGLLDCRDGKWYCPAQGTPSLPVIDGKSVVTAMPTAAVWDLASGETTAIDFGLPGWTVLCARYLTDGSVCGVLEDHTATLDKDNGQEEVVVIVAPDGGREQYPLGKRRFGQGMNTLMEAGDSRRVVAFSAATLQQGRPFLIDRDSGEASLLTRGPERLRAIPIGDCLDENGTAVIDAEDAANAWIPMAEMRDGTLLALDMHQNDLLLMNLVTLETDVLLNDEAMAELSEYRMALLGSPLPLTGNGLDVFTLRSQDKYLNLALGGGSLWDILFGK